MTGEAVGEPTLSLGHIAPPQWWLVEISSSIFDVTIGSEGCIALEADHTSPPELEPAIAEGTRLEGAFPWSAALLRCQAAPPFVPN